MEVQSPFRTEFSRNIFEHKYKHENAETWPELSSTLVDDVCQDYLSESEKLKLKEIHTAMQFVAAGRYLYYAGRPKKFFNNCYLLRALEDTREDWAHLMKRGISCLMTGGGIGVDYSVYRESGAPLKSTGGVASGPIPAMKMMNENGRNVMQGGSRRSAIYASLDWNHGDAENFIHSKDWHSQVIPGTDVTLAEAKMKDFNFNAPLDMTNISLNYKNDFLSQIYGVERSRFLNGLDQESLSKLFDEKGIGELPDTFLKNARQALMTGEPGFSFNFFDKENETLRNACTEITSEDDSDVCNLGSLNMGQFDSIDEFRDTVRLASKFLVCGTLRAHLPYEKVHKVRQENRRLGLGLMGVHEWLLKRGYEYGNHDWTDDEIRKFSKKDWWRYEYNNSALPPELHEWLHVYKEESENAANELCDKLGISRPKGYRAVAPTGSIGIVACTTTGIEPLFAVAYKRRYLKGNKDWHFQYVVDGTAKTLIENYGVSPDDISTALGLANKPEKRIHFQADIQDYVDHAISSTINLPSWGSEHNNEDHVESFARSLAKYAHRLRGFTCYPDGSRGGQPLTPCSYEQALEHEGEEFMEQTHDICEISGKGGSCGD